MITGTWRSRAVVLVSAVGLALPLGGTALADHGGGPSASDVAAGHAAVRDREAQVRAAAAAVSRAQGALDRLSTAAEVAVERYNGARVREQQARAEVRVAQVVVNAAAARVDAARARVSRFGRAAYMGGGMSSVDVLLTSSGPSSLLYRIGTLEVISSSQRDAMQSLEAARIYQLAVEKQAQAALDRAASAAKAAAGAKSAAQHAVAHQADLVTGLQTRRHELAALLRDARRHASALEQARLAAIARQQAAAAAEAAAAKAAQQASAPPPVTSPPSTGGGSGGGGGGSISGTVSADTEQRAVQAAESQIGKPYEWGAAGPDTYDCSGLTMWAYAQVGVSIDHYTGYQWNEGAHIPTSALRPGDLVFFATDTSDPNTIHHVGMYIGNGSMVEAPYTGANVRISPAFRSDMIGAVRPYNR